MQGSGSQAGEGLTVQGGAIAGMAFQSVTRKALGQATQQGIPSFLGQHTGGRDGGAVEITFYQGALGPAPAPQGQHPIDENQLGCNRESLQGAGHGRFGGPANAMAIDFRGTGLAQGPAQGLAVQQGNQRGPGPGRETFAIGETGLLEYRQGLRRQDDGSRKNWTKEGSTADFIDPGADCRIATSPDLMHRLVVISKCR